MYGYKFDYTTLLGATERNSTGHVTSARSAIHTWVTRVDPEAELREEGGTGIELDLADADTLAWEAEAIRTLLEEDARKEEVSVFINLGRR